MTNWEGLSWDRDLRKLLRKDQQIGYDLNGTNEHYQ